MEETLNKIYEILSIQTAFIILIFIVVILYSLIKFFDKYDFNKF